MSKIAFVTYRQAPRITSDDSMLYRPLAEFGFRLIGAAWDDLTVKWSDYNLVVIRSTWDYHTRPAEFLSWLNSLEHYRVSLWNPPNLIRWNMDKAHYMPDLAAKGIPILPTVFLEKKAEVDLGDLLQEQNWADVVIKPSIGASAYQTWRMVARQAASQQSRLNKLLENSGALIQPFMPQITELGEWSLIFFRHWSGKVEFSHAVLKFPKDGDIRVQDEYGGKVKLRQPPSELIHAAYRTLEAVPDEWLYARVDAFWSDEESFSLMELELIEPFLFLGHADKAADGFANAIRSFLQAR